MDNERPEDEEEDEEEEEDAVVDRRFSADSARALARLLFSRYDDTESGCLNSEETANLITDFYCSLNIDHQTTRAEGLDFMIANDIGNDGQFSILDFEEIFVHHLSTGNNSSGYNLFGPRRLKKIFE